MGIRCDEPPMKRRHFESRFKLLAQLWSWFMRRQGYDTNYMITHLGITKYFVTAKKEIEK